MKNGGKLLATHNTRARRKRPTLIEKIGQRIVREISIKKNTKPITEKINLNLYSATTLYLSE